MNYKISNKIKTYSFIMSVFVILVHSINNSSAFQKFVSNIVCQYAVPSFFIMSGILFFINIDNLNDVLKKIEKRIYTVLIPFFMWNAIYYLLNVIVKVNLYFDFNDLYYSIIKFKYNPVYWYMMQLIYIIMITPIIYMCFKNKFSTILLFTFSIALVIINPKFFINYDALIYFSFGAYVSRKIRNNMDIFINKKYVKPIFIVFLVTYIFRKFFITIYDAYDISTLRQVAVLFIIINRILGAIFIFYFIDLIFDYENIVDYMNYNFYLYSVHYIFIRLLAHILVFIKPLFINQFLLENIVYVFSPIFIVTFSYTTAKILKHFMPKYYNILVGGR